MIKYPAVVPVRINDDLDTGLLNVLIGDPSGPGGPATVVVPDDDTLRMLGVILIEKANQRQVLRPEQAEIATLNCRRIYRGMPRI